MTHSSPDWTSITSGRGIATPAGAYSPGARVGQLLFVSGQVPRDPATGALAGSDVVTQARQVFANLESVVRAAGGTLASVVAVTVYLADIGDWDAFNAVYAEIFRPPYPTRTTLGAQLHGFRIEASAIAVIAGGGDR
jgi:2-iminobutanoate/2-iminopropanoate deaminase